MDQALKVGWVDDKGEFRMTWVDLFLMGQEMYMDQEMEMGREKNIGHKVGIILVL